MRDRPIRSVVCSGPSAAVKPLLVEQTAGAMEETVLRFYVGHSAVAGNDRAREMQVTFPDLAAATA